MASMTQKCFLWALVCLSFFSSRHDSYATPSAIEGTQVIKNLCFIIVVNQSLLSKLQIYILIVMRRIIIMKKLIFSTLVAILVLQVLFFDNLSAVRADEMSCPPP